ncbi:MAG: agmatine/peptidylarginine deiminase [Micrococcales bacterium]
MSQPLYRMPAEWEPHERTWMAWPSSGYTLGGNDAEVHEARSAWAAVANAVVRFEPLTMMCETADLEVARSYLDNRVELVAAALDDAWMRDIGPSFVKKADGTLAAVNWVFNGWGAQAWASWEKDSKIATRIGELTHSEVIDSWLVNEGGGIHVNGAGLVMLTDTVQRGECRNPGKSREEVEAEIHRTLGTNRAIWFERGLTRDYDEFGTRGHVDIVACFANETTVLYHDQQDPTHPDFAVSAQVRKTLEDFGGLTLIPVAAPKVLRDEEGWVDYSYINHYIVNGGVILCAFGDPNDKVAKELLESVYPGREIVLVDARPSFARGGGIHCITQQQPA